MTTIRLFTSIMEVERQVMKRRSTRSRQESFLPFERFPGEQHENSGDMIHYNVRSLLRDANQLLIAERVAWLEDRRPRSLSCCRSGGGRDRRRL